MSRSSSRSPPWVSTGPCRRRRAGTGDGIRPDPPVLGPDTTREHRLRQWRAAARAQPCERTGVVLRLFTRRLPLLLLAADQATRLRSGSVRACPFLHGSTSSWKAAFVEERRPGKLPPDPVVAMATTSSSSYSGRWQATRGEISRGSGHRRWRLPKGQIQRPDSREQLREADLLDGRFCNDGRRRRSWRTGCIGGATSSVVPVPTEPPGSISKSFSFLLVPLSCSVHLLLLFSSSIVH